MTDTRRVPFVVVAVSLGMLAFGALVLAPAHQHDTDPMGVHGATVVAAPPEADSIYRALDYCLGKRRHVPLAAIRWVEADSIPDRLIGHPPRPGGVPFAGAWVENHHTIVLRRDAIRYEPERLELIAHELTHARLGPTYGTTGGHPSQYFARWCGTNGRYVIGDQS